MDDFKQRFEIIYKKFYDFGVSQGFKPSKLAFARFLNVLQGTMQNWEYKGSLPNGRDLKTIHDKLGFAYDWLISGEGEMFDSLAAKVAEQEKEIDRLKNRIRFGDDDAKDSAGDLGKAADGAS